MQPSVGREHVIHKKKANVAPFVCVLANGPFTQWLNSKTNEPKRDDKKTQKPIVLTSILLVTYL